MSILTANHFAVLGRAGAGAGGKRFAGSIDYRGGRNVNVRQNEWAKNGPIANGGDIFLRVDKTDLPERLGGSGIGVEGVNAVFLGGDEDDVVRAPAGISSLGTYRGWA